MGPTVKDDRPSARGFCLVGPTAVGKSAVAQWIAERHGHAILSADSMLVYDGMDIGTAKPSRAARARVRYHGVDLTTPDRSFSVGAYLACVKLSLAAPAAAAGGTERPLLVVGGTGLYVKSLLCGLAELPPANPSVRAYWSDLLEDLGVEALQKALQAKSPGLYEALQDKSNPRRLLRALELAEAGVARPVRTWPRECDPVPLPGLRLPPDQLRARIEQRVREMYEQGLLDEVQALRQRYPQLSSTAREAIGYAEAIELLAGRCSREDAMARTAARTRQLAKRQRTWFAHQLNVRWLDIEASMTVEAIAQTVLEHWRTHGPVSLAV